MHIVRSESLDFVPASHECKDSPGVLKKVLFTHHDLIKGRVQMVNWALLPEGKTFAPHYHEDMQEIFIMVNGHAELTIDGESAPLAPGDAVVVPIRCVHTMKNRGKGDVAYIVVGISTGKQGKTVVVDDR